MISKIGNGICNYCIYNLENRNLLTESEKTYLNDVIEKRKRKQIKKRQFYTRVNDLNDGYYCFKNNCK